MSWSDIYGTLAPYLLISYAVLVGFTAFVLSGVQEGARMSGAPTRFGIERWSTIKLIVVSALLAAPSLLLFLVVGILFVV